MAGINRLQRAAVRRLKWAWFRGLRRPSIVYDHYLGYRLKLLSSDDPTHDIYFGRYEPEETGKILELVQPGMTVLDVGANLGYFTLLMALRVGPEGKVHAFEPNPAMHKRLLDNLALNPRYADGRVAVYRLALSASTGEADFFCPADGNEGVGGLRDTKRAPVVGVARVSTQRLDELVETQRITKLDFIKMDIEGGELDALRGAERTLSGMKPVILFEAYELNTAPYGYRVFEILSYLEERGYVVTQAGMMAFNFLATPKH
jgi:FkbM family methyltransferase